MDNYGIWGILPPLLTIVLAFITKDVVVSLMVGIFIGSMIVCGGNPFLAITHLTDNIADNLSDGWNIRIVLFCLLLGGYVGLMIKTGATSAFAAWARKRIKSRRSSLVLTWFCGLVIFIDDYFNSLAVGTVMRPVTDKFNVSRAKLSYILDSTAAPVCILAPISSWVVTVMSIIKNSDGFENLGINEFSFFIRSIPYNLYAILTIFTVLAFCLLKFDFGPMKKSEDLALSKGILYDSRYGAPSVEGEENIKFPPENNRVRTYDMLIPLLVLICTAVVMFPVTTYMDAIDGESIKTFSQSYAAMSIGQAFNETDASKALFYAIIISTVFTYVYYLIRKLFNIEQASAALISGVKTMLPACFILAMAWTIGGIIKSSPADGGLGLSNYLSNVFVQNRFPIRILPFLVMAMSVLISFSTGSSWGTFSIMIPITLPIVVELGASTGLSPASLLNCTLFTVAGILSGAVFGDHVSPISDSTILSSTGAGCPHLEHVGTQMPYAVMVMASVAVGFLVGGLCKFSAIVSWLVSIACLVACFVFAPRLEIINSHLNFKKPEIGN